MDDFKPNSHRFKEEEAKKEAAQPKAEKKVEKIVKGTARRRKRGEMSKIKDVFISDDASNVKSYVIMDVLVPAVKKAIKDIVTDGIEMILYGDVRHDRDRRSGASYIDYSRASVRGDDRRRDLPAARTGYGYDDLELDSRGEAEEVLSRMDELIATYGVVSVADMYDLAGITPNYTDNRYGWTNIRTAEPVRLRNGAYTLKLPKALPIN